ncbi:MAG TPA: hypothetical protein EYP10_00025 [Armatimonadetes bacterium]|nr:hypothetical protein [Armatimonadota bacterium]
MLFTAVRLLSAAGIAEEASELEEATSVVRELSRSLSIDEAAQNNPAKALALRLSARLPVVYASRLTRSAAIRFKDSVNENAKARAVVEVLPELCHNEVVTWDAPPDVPTSTIFLRFEGEPRYVEVRFGALASIIERAGHEPIELRGEGTGFIAQILSLIYLLDYTSIYLAVLRGVNPLPTRAIDEIKRLLYRRK